MEELEYAWFKKKILEIAGIDLNSYRPDQMKRLIEKTLETSEAKSYVSFVKQLEKSPARIQEFKDSMTINVSHLFRDAHRWDALKEQLPGLISQKNACGENALRVWSAGCSIGAEPYSLAVLFEELIAQRAAPLFTYDILCTDIDNHMLRRGRHGIFTDRETKEVPRQYMKKYFKEIQRPEQGWGVRSAASAFFEAVPALKKNLHFRIHNLLSGRWETGFDLIVCRNLLIYFNNDVKEELFKKFQKSLLPHGLLFIGATEVIFTPSAYGLENLSSGIYRKAEPKEAAK